MVEYAGRVTRHEGRTRGEDRRGRKGDKVAIT